MFNYQSYLNKVGKKIPQINSIKQMIGFLFVIESEVISKKIYYAKLSDFHLSMNSNLFLGGRSLCNDIICT